MLRWANRYSIFCFLDNHDFTITPHDVNILLAAGVKANLVAHDPQQAELLARNGNWLFGHINYETGVEWNGIKTSRKESIGFPPFFFFVPQVVIRLDKNTLTIEADDPRLVFEELNEQDETNHAKTTRPVVEPVITKDDYISIVEDLRRHIIHGDCYEINFCQEFLAKNTFIDPPSVFLDLTSVSPNPFSALYKFDHSFLLCASPERFLAKRGDKIYSQPMKGTARRETTDDQRDSSLKDELKHSAKDQSENVMVVDLVRNDLSRLCMDGTVMVEELFGVYSYPNVHQMVSTVSGRLRADVKFAEIITSMFPMGSMTGAPKHRVMQLVEQYERSARGIYSGTVGYISPDGNFDFNVVIRSLMYNSQQHLLSYQVGSGITFYSDAEKEWDECILKAKAIREVLGDIV